MLIKKPSDIKPAEITPKELYMNRRQFIRAASATALSTGGVLGWLEPSFAPREAHAAKNSTTSARARTAPMKN